MKFADNEINISVIIPYYNETPEELSRILSSLNWQLGIDLQKIECILVNDIDNFLEESFINSFHNIDIKRIHLPENKGPGVARQAGLDAANGEYVLFCDSDDSLSDMTALNAILAEIRQNRPEVIVSGWLEEHYFADTGNYQYQKHGVDFVWLHGKALRRDFLQNNDIRFHPNLTAHEDNYFMGLVYAAAENMRQIQSTTYVWRARPESATRANCGAYFFEKIPDFLLSTGYLLDAVQRQFPQAIRGIVTQSIINIYFTLHTSEWFTNGELTRLSEADAAFGEIIRPYLHYFMEMPREAVNAVYAQQRAMLFAGETESETLDDWLARITASPTSMI